MRKNRQHPVSTGAMADVAFLLLVFFLVATQISEEEGILVTLPRIDAVGVKTDDAVFHVHVNAYDEILAGDKRIVSGELSSIIYHAIADAAELPGPGKTVISIHCDRGAKYETFVSVHDDVRNAFHQVWNETSERLYGLPFQQLGEARKREIREQIPMIVSEAEWTRPGE